MSNNQQRQGNFGFDRKTPPSFQAATAPTGQGATANQNAARNTVATVDEPEIQAEELYEEEAEEDSVTIPMSQFLSIATQAGIEISEDSMVAGI